MSMFTDLINPGNPGLVPADKTHLKRYPFVFLVDISGSTTEEPDPDIVHINRALNTLVTNLRDPIPSGPLFDAKDAIDVCIVAYNTSQQLILDWTTAENLPASIPPLNGSGITAMGAAIRFGLDRIADRLRYYRDVNNSITYGGPHIFHLTDGEPTDLAIGSPEWQALTGRVSKLDGTTLVEKRAIKILHFCSPKGYGTRHGSTITGADVLAQLSGTKSVYSLGNEIANFEQLVEFFTAIISNITRNIATDQAADQARMSLKPAA